MRAAYHKVPTQYLVDHGADPRAQNQSNVNALMASVMIAPYKKSTFKYFLDELQIDPNQRTTVSALTPSLRCALLYPAHFRAPFVSPSNLRLFLALILSPITGQSHSLVVCCGSWFVPCGQVFD